MKTETLHKNLLIKVTVGCLMFLLMFYVNIQKSYSQEENIDKLKEQAETSENAADKVDALYKLACEYKTTDHDKSYDYAKEAVSLAKELDKSSNTAILYVNVAYIYIVTKNDLNKAMQLFKKANRIADNMSDEKESKKLTAKIQEGLGLMNYKVHEYDLAIESYENALKLYTQLRDGSNISNCFHSLAILYDKKGDNKKSVQYYKRETANTKRLETKMLRKNAPLPEDDSQMVKMEDMDAFE